MNTTFNTAIAQLTIDDIELIELIVDALKAHRRELRTEKSELAKAEKAALKAQDKATKDAAKVQAKAVAKARVDAEKAALKTERDAEKAALKAERDAEKAALKAERDAEKAAAKAERDAEKAQTKKTKEVTKTLAGLQTKVLKTVKNETGEPAKPNNHFYQNFCKWSKGEEGPTEEDIKAAGGKRVWNKEQWDKLSKDERAAPDAPWNVIA